MSSFRSTFMKRFLQIFNSTSIPLSHQSILDKKVSLQQFQQTYNTISKLKVGDIILTKTPNLAHQLARKFVSAEYDHVSVVISETQGIQISPPQISRMSLKYLLLTSHSPLVLRLNWQPQMIKQFVLFLNSFIGESYDYVSLFGLVKDKFKGKIVPQKQNLFSMSDLKYHKICTNIIVYCLCRVNPQIQKQLKFNTKSYQFYNLGAFVPDDIINILSNTKSSSIIHQTKSSLVDEIVPSPTSKIVKLSTLYSFNKPQFFNTISNQAFKIAKKLPQILQLIKALQKYQSYILIFQLLFKLYTSSTILLKTKIVLQILNYLSKKIKSKQPKPKL